MKIAIYHNLPSGGAKRALFEYVRLLSKNIDFDLYTLSTSSEKNFLPLKKYINSTSIYPVIISKGFLSYLKFLYINLPKIQKKIADDINNKDYDLVWMNHDFFTKSPILINYIKSIPIIYFCHEPPREFYEPLSWHTSNFKHKTVNLLRYPLKQKDYLTTRKADFLITISDYSQKLLSSIYKRKVFKIKGGVDSKFFKIINLKRENYFLSVGALVKLKGSDFLINSIACLPDKYRLPLYLVGNGGRDENYFKNLASKKGIKLIIQKYIKDEELVDIYNKAYLFLYAPLKEPFGLAALEAMSCGLPVVGVKEGGLIETVGNKGFLTNRNEKEFSKIIYKLLNNRSIISSMRKKVREYVIRDWSWDNGAKQLDCFFRKAKNVKKS